MACKVCQNRDCLAVNCRLAMQFCPKGDVAARMSEGKEGLLAPVKEWGA